MHASLEPDRRSALHALGALAATAAGLSATACAAPPVGRAVRWSSGTQPPRSVVPPLATDCHHHIYDQRFPPTPTATLRPGDAGVADYQVLQRRLGTRRSVVVQPSTYGTDNRLLVESIAALGLGTTRGVAVVDTGVTDAELAALHRAGVRGIRFNLAPPGTTRPDMVSPLAARVAPMGWHVQVNAPAAALLEARSVWSDLPVPVVFDHLGRVPQPDALRHPTFAMVRDLVQRGRAWVKLSGFYNESRVGPPSYRDSVEVAAAYAGDAPERVLWGSDWPHPTEHAKTIPDDALLLDLLAEAVPDAARRNRILVDNPARLYQFA